MSPSASLTARDEAVLYFYPKDDTPGCTKEACNFRDRWDQLKANNITVWDQQGRSHLPQQFINKHELPSRCHRRGACAVASQYESYG